MAGQSQSLAGDILGDAGDLKHHAAGLDHGHPVLGGALTGAHAGLGRLLGDGQHTPGYAAPEQFNNLKKEIDSRADIFSLGVVTYECITGKNTFREGSINALEVLQKTETITPVQYSIKGDTQSQFMALLGAMMGKYPSRRPRTAKQAIDWLKVAKKTFVYE